MNTARRWTPAEVTTMLNLLDSSSFERVAQTLGRTPGAVANKLHGLGCGTRQGFLSMCAVSRATGWGWNAVRWAARRMHLGIVLGNGRVLLRADDVDRVSRYLADTSPQRLGRSAARRKRIGAGVARHWRKAANDSAEWRVGDAVGCGKVAGLVMHGRRWGVRLTCSRTGRERAVALTYLRVGRQQRCHSCAAIARHARRAA